MTDKEDWTEFINGDLDEIPIEVHDINDFTVDFSDDPVFDFSQKLGITANIYLDIGFDLRKLKRFNPKNHIIF